VGRILAIDFGIKLSGVAVTDPLQLSVNGLKGLPTQALEHYINTYLEENEVETLVIGLPMHSDGTPTYLEEKIQEFIKKIRAKNPLLHIARVDESYSSHKAMEIMIESKVPKMRRRNKSLLDKVSAMVILQSYLDKKVK
jgi:putative holliday junction resolvase